MSPLLSGAHLCFGSVYCKCSSGIKLKALPEVLKSWGAVPGAASPSTAWMIWHWEIHCGCSCSLCKEGRKNQRESPNAKPGRSNQSESSMLFLPVGWTTWEADHLLVPIVNLLWRACAESEVWSCSSVLCSAPEWRTQLRRSCGNSPNCRVFKFPFKTSC